MPGKLLMGLVVVTFLSVSTGAQLTPTIAQIAGTVAPGQILTITGANLHNEQRLNWDPFWANHPTRWSFEGAAPFGTGSDGYSKPGGDPGGVYDTAVKILGSQSIKFRSASNTACTGPGLAPSSLYTSTSLRQEYWVRVYVRWHRVTNWPNNYAKMLYALGAGYYFQPRGAGGRDVPAGMNATYDGMSHSVNVPGGSVQDSRWYAVEVHWKTTSPRLYEVFWDGVQVFRATPSGGSDLGAFLFGIINACGSEPWDIEHWMDGLALASSRIHPSAIVEVGNGPTYATARKVIQPLETISDATIRFRLDTRGLGAGPYYVWVRNNAQQLSAAAGLKVGGAR